MVKARVGVLRGGASHDYRASLAMGAAVLKHLPATYQGNDILIDRSGVWHWKGVPASPSLVARQVDVFWNVLSAAAGDTSPVSGILNQLGLPYTGSEMAVAALGGNRILAKEVFRRAGFRVPSEIVFKVVADQSFKVAAAAREVFDRISPPWVVKPASGGSVTSFALAKTFAQLVAALEVAKKLSRSILVEPYLRGCQAVCGVVDTFRGQTTYALPPVELGSDNQTGICPANFGAEEKREIETLAIAAHRALSLRHYSCSIFVLTAQGIYLLETNSSPSLTHDSHLPRALAAVGCPYPHFLDHVLSLALNKN
ncbi:MAG: hypothetical protein AAB415_03215 [Patescibacteria group bacterium]|mgnify:CR=1 FL=1